jgi:hypothetical protein
VPCTAAPRRRGPNDRVSQCGFLRFVAVGIGTEAAEVLGNPVAPSRPPKRARPSVPAGSSLRPSAVLERGDGCGGRDCPITVAAGPGRGGVVGRSRSERKQPSPGHVRSPPVCMTPEQGERHTWLRPELPQLLEGPRVPWQGHGGRNWPLIGDPAISTCRAGCCTLRLRRLRLFGALSVARRRDRAPG